MERRNAQLILWDKKKQKQYSKNEIIIGWVIKGAFLSLHARAHDIKNGLTNSALKRSISRRRAPHLTPTDL